MLEASAAGNAVASTSTAAATNSMDLLAQQSEQRQQQAIQFIPQNQNKATDDAQVTGLKRKLHSTGTTEEEGDQAAKKPTMYNAEELDI